MSISKKAVSVVVVWGAALASAVALASVLQPPVIPPDPPVETPTPHLVAPAPIAATEQPVIELDPIVIVGQRPTYARARMGLLGALPGTALRGLEEMRCNGWRELVQGDVTERVRACE